MRGICTILRKITTTMTQELQFIPFESRSDKGWAEAWDLYEESFPRCERWNAQGYDRAFGDPRFEADGIWRGEEFIGILFHWNAGAYRYVEHLAVSPAVRGQNMGSKALTAFCRKVGRVILENAPVVHLLGKGRKRRSVPLWNETARTLKRWIQGLRDRRPDAYLFPNNQGGRLSRSSVRQRLDLAVDAACRDVPSLKVKAISPHTFRHTTAMHLLQSGVDLTVIALWLGHEDTSTTHIYMEADLAMKQEALSRLQPVNAPSARYRPPDQLMHFLQSL